MSGRIASVHELTALGAPFRVLLLDSIEIGEAEEQGAESIPDFPGLIREILAARVEDPRRLSGEDVRFVRKAMQRSAQQLCDMLGIDPNMLTQVESGERVLPPPEERLLRLAAMHTACRKLDRDRFATFMDEEFKRGRRGALGSRQIEIRLRHDPAKGWLRITE